MIVITNIRNINNDNYDEIWAIVRSLKHNNGAIKQVTSLSPSTELFYKYLSLKNNGNWDKNAFDTIYVPQFIREIRKQPDAIEKLGYLYQQDKMNKKICLVCFCTDETLCHRSIIAGLLQGVGANVITETQNDYSKYFEMFKKEDV